MNYELKISINDGESVFPEGIFARVIIPDSITFFQLHKVIMACSNFNDYHEWSFRFDNKLEVKLINFHDFNVRLSPQNSGASLLPQLPAQKTTLAELFNEYNEVRYIYDYTNPVIYTVSLVATYPNDKPVGLLAHGGYFPPEDVGGINGFLRLRELEGKDKSLLNEEEAPFVTWFTKIGYPALDHEKVNEAIKKIIVTDFRYFD